MSDCVFCKIVRGEIPCARVFEDEHVLAFDDIHPMAPVHVVIIPKKHIATLMDVDVDNSDVIHRLTAAAQKVARIKKIDQSGFRTAMNCNADGGQVVFHLHVHVFGGRQIKMELE